MATLNDHPDTRYADLPIARDRDRFLRELLRELSGVLEDTVGLEQAEGFIALVGGRLGQMMNEDYCAAIGQKPLDQAQIASVLVDLKRRIEGGFSIESIDDKKIVLSNTACPFARHVLGRPSLCMMTSNVFGRIAADNLGYARVVIDQAIAQGDPGCRVVVYFTEGDDGREYFA